MTILNVILIDHFQTYLKWSCSSHIHALNKIIAMEAILSFVRKYYSILHSIQSVWEAFHRWIDVVCPMYTKMSTAKLAKEYFYKLRLPCVNDPKKLPTDWLNTIELDSSPRQILVCSAFSLPKINICQSKEDCQMRRKLKNP